jgi:SAM-dependent methyltransferase
MTPGRDPWLQRWLPLLAERSAGASILELGCGSGQDSAVLAAAGHAVVGVDLSERAIAGARARVPSASFHCQDIRAPFPVAPGSAGAVVASLSLHYFPWPETIALVERIRETLHPRGVLLCRLNSTNDHEFGASGHPEIEPHYYMVEGEAKRFFDRAAVARLFADGWRMLGLEESIIDRYDRPKAAWEAVLEPVA